MTNDNAHPSNSIPFFANTAEFRHWLEKNHLSEKELVVGYYKKESGKPSMSWSESVDVALCFGWIDSIRRTIDQERYSIRFTPRRKAGYWSAVNIKKVENLIKQGLMLPEGVEAFEQRKEENSRVYSFENRPKALDASLDVLFRSNKTAWDFFETQAPSYKKTIYFWIMSAKQEQTKMNRLLKLIAESENHKRL